MEELYDVIIIGSGPAGMAAAIYGSRAGLKTLLLEKTGIGGGQVLNTYDVDNYPGLPSIGGIDLSMKFREHAEKLGVPIVSAEVTRIMDEQNYKTVCTDQRDYQTKTVIIATGASYAKLGIPGEEEFAGMGVSYCATCDGAFFRNKTVAVVGGGDVAVEDAIFLARKCEKVYLVHRRDELRAAKVLQESLFQLPNIELVWDSVTEQIVGTDVVEGLKIRNKKTDEERTLDVQGVFVAVGTIPNSTEFVQLVKMDEKGNIIAGETCETSVPGIFVAGDVRTKALRQIITAAADGANAITSVEKYLLSFRA